jgi:hypothetical protein
MLKRPRKFALWCMMAVVLIGAARYRQWFQKAPPQTLPGLARHLQLRLGLHSHSTMASNQSFSSLFLSRERLTWEKCQLFRTPARIHTWTGIVLAEESSERKFSVCTDGWDRYSFQYKSVVFFGDPTLLDEIARELSQFQ